MDDKSLKARILKSATDLKVPIVFVSYDTSEVSLAHFIASLIENRCGKMVRVFIAKRDIPPGSDPFKILFKENLLIANHIVSICTQKSKLSSWLWWETACVWANNGTVYPLYVDIKPEAFGDPIKSISQGREYFIESELQETLEDLLQKLGLEPKSAQNGAILTHKEKLDLQTLRESMKETKTPQKEYFTVNRIIKSNHPLGELFNISDQDLIDLDIKVTAIDARGEYESRDPRVIGASEPPISASPYNLRTIRKNETKYIYNFPRSAKTKVQICGRAAHSGIRFDETHDVD